MKEQIMQILIPAVISILTILVTAATSVFAEFIKTKQRALVEKIGAERYNQNYIIARDVYYSVEQYVRRGLVDLEDRAKTFDRLLADKIPYLTVEEVEHFRESVIGEVHQQIKDLEILDLQ